MATGAQGLQNPYIGNGHTISDVPHAPVIEKPRLRGRGMGANVIGVCKPWSLYETPFLTMGLWRPGVKGVCRYLSTPGHVDGHKPVWQLPKREASHGAALVVADGAYYAVLRAVLLTVLRCITGCVTGCVTGCITGCVTYRITLYDSARTPERFRDSRESQRAFIAPCHSAIRMQYAVL